MTTTNKLTIGLLSHLFQDDNLGCTALSISNMMLIDKAAKECGYSIKYKIFVNEKAGQPTLDFTANPYQYFVYSSCKQTIRHPVKLLRTKIFDDCDVVFNLCAGDGFTSIYGLGRTLSEVYMTALVKLKGGRIILAPQTIGPFDTKISKWLARVVMNSCHRIFTRDALSTQCCAALRITAPVTETADVAFSLPYEKREQTTEQFHVGLNVSGLLYRGGYDRDNYFDLSFDYKSYVKRLIEVMLQKNYRVHLVAHVISSREIEDDYSVCRQLSMEYEETVLAPLFQSPIEAKGYIAGLDLLIGARMHATIAAISSHIPVIPVAYSRKVNGLYDSLNYPYYIDARDKKYSLNHAVDETIRLAEMQPELKKAVLKSREIYTKKLLLYSSELEKILCQLHDK